MDQGYIYQTDGRHTERRDEDRLLLDEANHRTANEVTAAIAAMRIARNARNPKARLLLLDGAIARLEGFGECCRLLAGPPATSVDAGDTLARICSALLASRPTGGPATIVLGIVPVVTPGETARRIAMVAHELVTNALKHAFHDGGTLEVRLEPKPGAVALSVIDKAPIAKRRPGPIDPGVNLGGGIIAGIVGAAGGILEYETGARGTAVHVVFPMTMPALSEEIRHG